MKKTITLLAVCLLLMSVLAGFTAFFNRTEEVGYFTALKVTIRSNAINVYSIISLIFTKNRLFLHFLPKNMYPLTAFCVEKRKSPTERSNFSTFAMFFQSK